MTSLFVVVVVVVAVDDADSLASRLKLIERSFKLMSTLLVFTVMSGRKLGLLSTRRLSESEQDNDDGTADEIDDDAAAAAAAAACLFFWAITRRHVSLSALAMSLAGAESHRNT